VPYEIMLSESQERMLVIVKKGREGEVERIFEKWDLHAVKIGEVVAGHDYIVKDQGKVVAQIPAKALADEGPVYIREEQKPAYLAETAKLDLNQILEPQDFNAVLLKLLAHPSIASKAWVWEQYNHMVRTDTVLYPGHDAALIRVKGTEKGIAVATDCNSLYVYLDPFRGGTIAVAEAARNVACTGARPVGMTNCLNYGNPMKPDIFWQFHQSVLGLIESCKTLEIPVTGGNVSFYNESPQAAVFPTPTISIVGVLDKIENRVPSSFQNEGDLIFMIGETKNEIGASHYLMVEHGLQKGVPPVLDLNREKKLQQFLIQAAAEKLVSSAHDTSEGGLALALAECCFKSPQGWGAVVDGLELIRQNGLREDAIYFGESQSRVIVSAHPDKKESLIKLAMQYDLPVFPLGKVFGEELVMEKIKLPVETMKQTFESAIPSVMDS